VEECAVPPYVNFGHASRLELTLSNREKTGIQLQAGTAQNAGNQSSKIDWLNQVEGERNSLYVQDGAGLEAKEVPSGSC
jgi:hypothetical protein